MEDNEPSLKSEAMIDPEDEVLEEGAAVLEESADLESSATGESEEPSEELEVDDLESLQEKRTLIRHLLETSGGQEGDFWNIIPEKFLQAFLNADVTSLGDLKLLLGPLNTAILTDSHGLLPVEENQDNKTVAIHPTVFQYLVSWFGLEGTPVSRALLVDESGNTIIERFPPYFIVHSLTTKSKVSNFNSSNNCPNGFFLSKISTFQQLHDTIKTNLFKNHKMDFRIWFLNGDNLDQYPSQITVTQFLNEIQAKSLVLKEIMNDTLKHQQVNLLQYHILIELQDKSFNYPISEHVSSLEDLDFDFDEILGKGGNVGLINLGNTCYMNSALQCLVHVPEINYYFFYSLFMRELNKSNPLGYNGNMAEAFGSLLHKLFNDPLGAHQSSISPREFKYTIGHFSSMFQGYQQQDSQEFLSWLLDSLHEDLNRIYDKPYLEKPELKDEEVDDMNAIKRLADISWDQFKKRNDSTIIDLFSGLYQSVLVCPDCSKTSITYDPFNDLTLPLPVDKKWYHTFTVVNLDFSDEQTERIVKLQVELNKTSTFDELLDYLARFLKVDKSFLFLYELFNEYVYQDFQSNNKKYNFIPISELINKDDNIIVYIIPHKTTDLIVPVLHAVPDKDKSYNIVSVFGVPLFITVDEDEVKSFGKIRGKLEQITQLLTSIDINEYYKSLKTVNKQYYSKNDFKVIEDEVTTPDGDSEEMYDSDISFADPEVSGNFGFTIKYFCDYRYKEDPRKKIHFPRLKPLLSGLPELAEKLPEKKYNYYHYPNFKSVKENNSIKELSPENNKRQFDQENEENIPPEESDKNELGSTESSSQIVIPHDEGNDVGDQSYDESESPEKHEDDKSSIEDDSSLEASDNERLGLLFDSVSTLPKPTNETADMEITKDNHPLFLNQKTLLVCEWDSDIYEKVFLQGRPWENLQEIPNPELEANKAKLLAKQKNSISLYDCLDNFNKPEILSDQDLWYCPKCKDHKQATKTIKIWSTGDILTIHLKRFQVARSFSDKIDITIDFPIEGLDMSSYVHGLDGLVYDLIAVDNHYGGLGGGHYTASALNFRDKKWYYFNDGRVTEIHDPKECITGAAYLLFYRKRSEEKFLGGDKLNHLLTEGEKDYKNNLAALREQFHHLKQQVEAYSANDLKEETTSLEMDVESGTTSESSNTKKSRSPVIDDSCFDNKKRLLNKDKEIPESD